MVESYVGWPLDMVARKVLKKPVLVGREALDNRSMLDLHRPLEQGLIKDGSEKDEAAVRELLWHLLSLVGANREARNGMKVRAVVGVPAEALRINKQQVRKALQDAVDSLMIVSEPFAVAYGLEALLHTMIIDIGAGTTDFCVMNGRLPTEEDQRTLTQAGDFVDDQLMRLTRERFPEARFSIHMVRTWKEEGSFVGMAKTPVVVTAPVNGKPTQLDITREMQQACESILPSLTESMLDLLSPRAARVSGEGAQQRRPLRRHGPHPRSRAASGAGAANGRRRQGQGGEGSDLRRLGRRPLDLHRRSGQRLGAAERLGRRR